ncbi:MAG: hypothetical protein VX374_21155 [Pseudomonadota bacterium]|nr:hypothetical protein [Pseudomonadota bacterium]
MPRDTGHSLWATPGAAGRDTHEQLWPHLAGAYRQMFKGISDADQRAFVATLQAILKNVRKHPI